ncbi:archaellin/type IV pilin N-terminal domain-containing protein [Nitrosopumilus sp.]|uniref:archaellin/type IV pilin N-terminal domain-containing protein n=1 Tax=Nitrosopumilus sp. TaxID=2024843 RepID=UPI00262B0472|nr:archaellin/type IV pilin N-terminal domain-containing protein [Nitrosopumilus sp.]
MTKQQNKYKISFGARRGVSPILATVILLGVTVVGGGLTFGVMQQGSNTAAESNAIQVETAQAVKGTDHADLTATVKNIGTKNWVKLEMTVAKTGLSEPLLYESLHENVKGCTEAAADCADDNGSAKGRDNPLRAQWIAHIDKASGEDDRADYDEGISVGRKLVFDNKDDYRTVAIMNNTAVAPLFGGSYDGAAANPNAQTCTVATDTDCSAVFNYLDPSSGYDTIYCTEASGVDADNGVHAFCDVFTHQSIKNNPVQPGESKYFYADVFVEEVPGLNNQVVKTGDALVVNLVAQADDGSNTRVQTIVKVTGT